MHNLKYRRQFLLTPVKCDLLEKWQVEKVGGHFVYVHPDCLLTKAKGFNELCLIGYIINPHDPTKTSRQILDDLSQLKNLDDFPSQLYALVGRFVLIVRTHNDLIFFNDPCGLRTFYYTKRNGKFYAASQPLLLNEVMELKKTRRFNAWFSSDYVATHVEHWLPSGATFYEDTYHLVPNHSISASDCQQRRYYPARPLEARSYSALLEESSALLKKIILAANHNLNLAFTLTSGWDSRIILSACKDIAHKVDFYTLRYRSMRDGHSDIKIPMALARKLGLRFEIFDCEHGPPSIEFSEIYQSNTDMAHLNDWGLIAYGMSKTYPENKVAVKGTCSEIVRCFYYSSSGASKEPDQTDLLAVERGWGEIDFVTKQITKWYESLKGNNLNYNLYDLFYWEHRMGSWQAQSQLEWDVVQESFSPFNSRELLDLMLTVDASKRKLKTPSLYTDIMKHLWNEVLSEPINPVPVSQKIRQHALRALNKTGYLPQLRKLKHKCIAK